MSFDVPTVEELLARSHVVNIPLIHPFRGLTSREVMVLEGPEGPGEWAAFPEYPDNVAALWLRTALEQAFDHTVPPAPPSGDRVAVNAIFPALPPAAVASPVGDTRAPQDQQ